MTEWAVMGYDRFTPGRTTLHAPGRRPFITDDYQTANEIAAALTAQRAEGLTWKPLPTTRRHTDDQQRHRTRRDPKPDGPPPGW